MFLAHKFDFEPQRCDVIRITLIFSIQIVKNLIIRKGKVLIEYIS